jgi:hypothetical protein
MYKIPAPKNHQNTRDRSRRIATGPQSGMSATKIDFAVLGDSPQARLIAGLLASTHKKRVIYQGESQSGYRLPRALDLSVAPLTRPETWALLQRLTTETQKLIARLGGRGAMSRIDPIFSARIPAAVEAVGHIRHMAQAFAFAAERVPGHVLGVDRQGVVFRDALLLHRPSLEPLLDKWLATLNVVRLDMETPLVMKPDGSAVVVQGDQGFEIGQTVLADDAAITTHLSEEIWPAVLKRHMASSVLSEAGKSLASALIYDLDNGIMLSQQARAGLVALGPGTIEEVSGRLGEALGGQRIRQAGQSSYQRIQAMDNAPAVGRVGGTGPDIVAGFGITGAFWAPATARWLAGVGSTEENAWFGARLVDRDPVQSRVSEWGDPL